MKFEKQMLYAYTKLRKEKKVMAQVMDACAQKITIIVPVRYVIAK